MTVTKTIVQNSPTRCKIKINADAAVTTGQAQIVLKRTVVISGGPTLTFTAGTKGTATITRSSVNWQTDITTALGTIPQPRTSAVTGSGTNYGGMFYLDLTGCTALDPSNQKVFTVTGLNNLVATVQENVTVADNAKASTGATAYYSDVGYYQQTLGLLADAVKVNISKIVYSVPSAAANNINVIRNGSSVMFLSGMQEIDDVVSTIYSGYDLDTIITGGGGMIVFELIKATGFVGQTGVTI